MTERKRRLKAFMVPVLAGGLLLWTGYLARADHSMMDPAAACYSCHTLKTSEVLSATKSIRTAKPKLGTLANGTTWTGGMPLSCDFCHQAGNDVPTLVKSTKTSRHPVDTIGNETNPTREISCNDCHNAGPNEVTPQNLTTNGTDGYPDHGNLSPDNTYSHTLKANFPHLTQGLLGTMNFSSATPRVSDGTFWSGTLNGATLVCFVCHGGASYSPPFTGAAGRSIYDVMAEYNSTSAVSGHRIRANFGGSGALPQGAKLPCYDCHDAHGSANRKMVLDGYYPNDNGMRNIEGTSSLATTAFTSASPGANGDNKVCAGCHNTGLAATQFSASGRVEKLNPVDPFVSLPSTHAPAGSWASPSGTTGCISSFNGCHSSPHDPVGESSGGTNCAACHSGIYGSMASGSSSYHHVMYDNATTYTTTVPSSSATDTNRRCTMCHVDHNLFRTDLNASNLEGRAANLRTAIGTSPGTPPTTTGFDNTDFLNSGSGGICLSCHTAQRTKNVTNQKDDATDAPGNATHVVVPSFGTFNSSAHNYGVGSTFTKDSSAFSGNCVKCHNADLDTADYNNRPFTLHNATSGRLLALLGGTAADSPQEAFCYRCHSETTDAIGGTVKGTAGRDWYGASGATMTSAAERIYKNFNLSGGSRHPMGGNHTSTASVECENCHNPHIVSLSSKAVNPDNTLATAPLSTVSDNVAFCLKCHDGTPPAYTNTATAIVPYTVFIPAGDSASMNKSTYASKGHWSVQAGTAFDVSGNTQACGKCHDQHGSNRPKLLGTYDGTGSNKVVGTQQTVTVTDNNSVCSACHNTGGTGYPTTNPPTLASIATYEGYRNATGYFSTITPARWPGFTAWTNVTYSPHGGASANYQCTECHDVHGTANAYDELNTTIDGAAAAYDNTSFTLCFNCHDGSPSTKNIKQYYPSSAGGTNANSRSGHRVLSANASLGPAPKLHQGDPVPCYDCHMTHGSVNGNTNLLSDQRWNGITSTGQSTAAEAANTRKFCLGCHVTTGGTDGSNTAVGTTAEVEGILRNNASYVNNLKLPTGVAEHAYIASPTAGQSCYFCHGFDYTGAGTNNVHNPSGGAGTPGTDCKACHNQAKSGFTTFRNVQLDFDKTARHVGAWATITSRDCEACHYALHGGYPKLWINAASATTRPASPAAGTDYFEYQKGSTVKSVVDQLCLSCHKATGGYDSLLTNTGQNWQYARKFSTGGTVPTPDVNAPWMAATTTNYSKYNPSTYNVVPQILKAYSPHRLPVTNKTKPDYVGTTESHGYVDGNWPPTLNSVSCLECHPSHGSNLVSGHTGGDYSALGLGKGGYMLAAENTKNQSGNIHDPSDNPAGATAAYASEEELCWNCHVRGWDYRGDDTVVTARLRWQGSWSGDITWVTNKGGPFKSSHYYPNGPTLTKTTWNGSGVPSGTRTNLACSTCHNAHGIDTTTTNAAYMVPALRATWLTSPYKEDRPPSAGNYQTDTGSDWRTVTSKGYYKAGVYGPTASTGTNTNKGARMVPDLGLGAPGTKNNPTTPGFGYSATKSASIGDGYFIDENTFGVGSISSTTSGGGWMPTSGNPATQEWGTWDGGSARDPSTTAAIDPATKWWILPKHFDGYLGYTETGAPALATSGGATPTDTPTGGMIDTVFGGLCLKCHPRDATGGSTAPLLGAGYIYAGHVSVAGWGALGPSTKTMVNDTNRPYQHMQQRVGINNYLKVDGTYGELSQPVNSYHDGPVGYRWAVDPGWISAGTGTSKTPTAKVGTQSSYHRFPCSKCHTPHASRLPRLMVTNCLDVGTSNTQLKNSAYLYPQTTAVGTAGLFGLQGTEIPWMFAVTCHADRDGKPGGRSTGASQLWYTSAPGTSGWNDVTPW